MIENPNASAQDDDPAAPIAVDFPTSGSLFPRFVLSTGFWFDRASWPNSSQDQIFLGHAVFSVGQAMFPGLWTDSDAQARKEPDVNGARDRLLSVAQWIVERALKGDFATLTWDGVALKEQPKTIWIRPDAFPAYFQNCSLSLPEGIGSPHLIFFEGQGFRKAVKELLRAQRPGHYTITAETQCDAWLATEFETADRRAKSELRERALKEIPTLSARGFDRSWSREAPKAGRNKSGRPSKSGR